jgi:prepilin-type N-terminal cleavage/methylation domain-containing protein
VKRPPDEGFTLVELLIAMFIAAIVFTTMANVFKLTLNSSDEGQQRLSESQDSDFTDSYFTKDAQSTDTVSTTTASCGSGAGTVVVALSWTEPGVTKNVTYWRGAGTDTALLTRYACDGGSVTSSRVVARDLAATPTVTCTPVSCTAATRLVMTIQLKTGATFTFRGSPRKTRP